MTLIVRDATIADAPLIADYNFAMAVETEDKALDRDVLLAGVSALLNDPKKGRYWIAEKAGKPVGQIMVNWEWSDWRNGFFWWIQSVYIDRDHRRQGVFSALHERVRETAKESKDAIGVRLYVEKRNTTAISTYEALNFKDAGYAMMISSL
ncbi:MAG: N-acetyltransferase family protein [Woeseiaceae bacterium]